jgi:hypothetical protein
MRRRTTKRRRPRSFPIIPFAIVALAISLGFGLGGTLVAPASAVTPTKIWYPPYNDAYYVNTGVSGPCRSSGSPSVPYGWNIYGITVANRNTGKSAGWQDTQANLTPFCSTNVAQANHGVGFHMPDYSFGGTTGTYELEAQWTYTMNLTSIVPGCSSTASLSAQAYGYGDFVVQMWDNTAQTDGGTYSVGTPLIGTYSSYCWILPDGETDQVNSYQWTSAVFTEAGLFTMTNGHEYIPRASFSIDTYAECDQSAPCHLAESTVGDCRTGDENLCAYQTTLNWMEIFPFTCPRRC